MGLWDILVPSEPGVLHNLIANPSFEYDNNELDIITLVPPSGLVTATQIQSYRTLPSNTGLVYWSTVGNASIQRSSAWASRGGYSLKVAAGATTNAGATYNPISARPSMAGVSIAVTEELSSNPAWDKIPSGKSFFVAVVGLTDTGVSLLNGLADTQVYQGTTVSDKLPYLTIDALRGHTAPKYATLTGSTTGSTSIKVSVSDSNVTNFTVRAWAIFYSIDTTTTKTYTLAAVTPATPAVANASGLTEVYIHTIINTAIATTSNRIPQQPTLGTGKVYMFPWALGGQTTLKGVSTKFLQECPANTDIYTVDSAGSKIFLGRVATSSTYTTTGVNKITVSSTSSTAFSIVGTPDANSLIGRAIYTTGGAFVGIVATASSSTAGNFEQNAAVTVANLNYQWTDATQTEVRLEQNATQTPIGESFYYAFETNPQTFPGNNVGAISTFTSDGYTNPSSATVLPLSMGLDCTTPYFGITNSSYGNFTKKHHLYLDWYLSSSNTNPNATYTDTGKNWSIYLYNNNTATGTLIGTLDDSTVTSANAHRMMLRKKFLITRPSGDTSNMSIRILYTGTTSDADLYIDGVQFVDVGMVWRAYDWYTSNPSSYTTPYQFSDWDWDDVEFSYIDGDTPGAIWSDTMPLQTGTYTVSFPYFTTSGVWHQNVNEYTAVQDMGGYGSPAFREQRQWRNVGKPIYGVSVPGLSQSAMLTQSFETGFWAPLNTSNINVVVEPTVSGPGMPEIATTSLEYGITDGGFVQRQIARMRSMQLNVTISANSWTGLHANRRSLINLLKFDQLAQQGERMLRYRGADTPVITRITYISGLEYSGVNNQSFTETLGLKFLSTDPYFYVETPLSTDVSPTSLPAETATVYYKLGRSSEWTPLSYHQTTPSIANNLFSTNGTSTSYRSGSPYFYTKTGSYDTPKAIGWLQSPSGNVSTLVVGGNFSYPFSTLAFFYISGFSSDAKTSVKNVQFSTSAGITITSALNSTTVTVDSPGVVSASNVNKFLFVNTQTYVGKITSVNTGANTYQIDNNNHPAYTGVGGVTFVTVSTNAIDANPLQVSGRQLFQMTGGSSAVNASVNAIYQESGSSIIVVGDFYQVVDLGTRQPDFNLNITSSTVANGFVSSSTISSGITSTPFFRVARFVMNDNGRIVVYPMDSQFTYDQTTAAFRSVLYNQIFNQTINTVTKSPNGYVFAGTDVNGSINKFDNTASETFAPLPVYRSSNAFGTSNYQSNVTAINPEISVTNTSGTEQYTGFVGFRLGAQRFGFISTFPNGNGIMPFIVIGYPPDNADTDYTVFTQADVGKLVHNVLGVYIGQIYYVYNPSGQTYSIAYLTQPAQIQTTKAQFLLSASVTSITTDKKATNATIFAGLDSAEDGQYRASAWAYVSNPETAGYISTVLGSQSIGYTGSSSLSKILGTNAKANSTYTPLATVTKNDDTVLGWNTAFSSRMIGNYITTTSGAFVGKIKTIISPTKLVLTANAENVLGTGTTSLNVGKGTITITTADLKAITITGLTLVASALLNQYIYQWINNTNTVKYIGQISANTTTTITLFADSQIGDIDKAQYIVQKDQVYVKFTIRSQKVFVNDDGYIAKSSYISLDTTSDWYGNTVLPATATTLTSKHLAYANNAWAMYADTQSSNMIMNMTGSLGSKTDGVIRRSFYGDTTYGITTATQQTAYNPSESSALIPSYANVYASYAFGTVAPYMDSSWKITGFTWSLNGTTFTASVAAFSSPADVGKLIYITIANRIVFAGKINSVSNTVSVQLVSNNAGTFSNSTADFYIVPDGTNSNYGVTGGDYIASNNAKLVLTPFYIRKIGLTLFETRDYTGSSLLANVLSSKDIGRSIYLYNGGIPKFLGVITGYSSPNFNVTVDVLNLAQDSTVYAAMLSGGAPGVPTSGTGGNATWYPFQFSFTKGGSAGYYEYSSVNTGMMFSAFSTMSGAGVLILNTVGFATNSLASAVPTGLTAGDYSVYGYINSISVTQSANSYSPTLIGQWKYLGSLSTTAASSISINAFASGAGNTIAIGTSGKSVTVATTGSLVAPKLVGTTIWTSGGTLVGNVVSSTSDTVAVLATAYGSTFAATTYYYTYTMTFNSSTGSNVGTPLCIVKNTTIYTDSPDSYAVDDELFAYADSYGGVSFPSLQYVGTIQKIVSTVANNAVTVSYMPYFGSAASPLNSTNIFQSNPFDGISVKSSILRSTKALRGSSKANYFADVLGRVNTAGVNPNNTTQYSLWTLEETAQVNVPNIYQTVSSSGGTTFTFDSTSNQGSFVESSSGNYSSSITVNYGSTAISMTGVAPYPTTLAGLANKALFRYDGAYIGVVNASGTALVANPINSGMQSKPMPYLYCDSSNNTTATLTTVAGSKTVTYTVGTGVTIQTLQGKALWNSTTGDFIGIVSYAGASGTSLILNENAPATWTTVPFAYASTTSLNTINASGTTTVTVTGYLPKSAPVLSSLLNMGLWRKNTSGASPYIQWVGYVNAVTQNGTTNTATLISTTGTSTTSGAESYLAAQYSNTGTFTRTNATTLSAITVTMAVGQSIWRYITNSTGPVYGSAVFVGVVKTVTGSVSPWTITLDSATATAWTTGGAIPYLSGAGNNTASGTIIGSGNYITTTAGSRTFTTSGTPLASAHVGRALFDNTGVYIGTCVGFNASSTSTGYFEEGATIFSSNIPYNWMFATYNPIITTTQTAITSGYSFINANAGSTNVNVYGQPDGYALVNKILYTSSGATIGTVASAITANAVTLVANALVGTGGWANYQYGTASTMLTDTGNTLISNSGSTAITVAGYPTAYELVGRTIYTTAGALIGTVSHATSNTAGVLVANAAAAQTSAARYQIGYAHSITPFATLDKGVTNTFAFATGAQTASGLFAYNGRYMGGVASVPSISSFNFANLPYENTVGATSNAFIYMPATVPTTESTVHVGYKFITNCTINVTEGSKAGTIVGFPNASQLVGSRLILYGTEIGVIASYNGGTSITLAENSRDTLNSSISQIWYNPTPSSVVFAGVITASTNDSRVIRESATYGGSAPIGIVESSQNDVLGTLTTSNASGFDSRSLVAPLGNARPVPYTYTSTKMKYFVMPGDVVRKSSTNQIIGQVYSIDYNAKTIQLMNNAIISISSEIIKIHHKHAYSEVIGALPGTIVTKLTTSWSGAGNMALISASNSFFSSIPVDYLNKSSALGTTFYVYNPTQNVDNRPVWQKVGVVYQILSNTQLLITPDPLTISDFSGASYVGGISVRSMQGVGQLNITGSGMAYNIISSSLLAGQAYSGSVITPFTANSTSPGSYRIIDGISSLNALISDIDGSPYLGGVQSNMFFNIDYLYDEAPVYDAGESVYINNDWQGLGASNNPVLDLTTTQNGSIIASGSFTQWADASDTAQDDPRKVGRVARIVPLISEGVLIDAYATPIVGSSYANNGFNNTVYAVQDVTEINPVNGYVGSSDRLFVGGDFTKTLNGENVSPGLAYVEGSTIAGNLQHITNADIVFPSSSTIYDIAATNRLRQYSSSINTNYLDGINGTSVAIITSAISPLSTMQYYSIRVRGNASTYPVITIRNDSTARKLYELYQTETGARVVFANNGLEVLVYETITISFQPGNRNITSNIRGNLIAYVDPTSNFVDWVLLGANNSAGKSTQSYDDYRLNVIGIHAQTQLTVTLTYTPRFWSFDANNMFFGSTKAGL